VGGCLASADGQQRRTRPEAVARHRQAEISNGLELPHAADDLRRRAIDMTMFGAGLPELLDDPDVENIDINMHEVWVTTPTAGARSVNVRRRDR
jgi:Flp pilus assembly CpaF family ATPase